MPINKKPETVDRKPFVCRIPCWHGGHRYRLGQTAYFADGEWPKDKFGKMLHFEPLNPASPPPPPEDGPVKIDGKKRPEK